MGETGTVLVTGATGMIGSAVVSALRKTGIPFRSALRTSRTGMSSGDSVVVGDLTPSTDWSEALAGVRVVIHIAGRAHARQIPRDELFSTNAGAVATLAREARDARVERLVFLSTIKVNGELSPEAGFRESDRPEPSDDYARSKKAGEDAVVAAGREGLDFTIVRTPLVYGAGVKANFLALMRGIDRGVPLPFGAIRSNRRSLIYVENLSDALIHLMQHPAARNETFLVADEESLSTRDLALRIGHALGRKPKLIPVPASMLEMAGGMLGQRDLVSRLTGSSWADTTKIRRLTGWRPPISVDDGLARTAEWYRTTFARRS